MKVVSADFIKSGVKPPDFPDEGLPEVAFVGRSNVGKSSLINSLVGRKGLAKTSSTPGRTQLINFFRINDKIVMVDLPGYGYAKVSESVRKGWRPMIEGYFRNSRNIKAVVFILDIRREPGDEDGVLMDFLSDLEIPVIVALTKVDKLSGNERTRQKKVIERYVSGQLIPYSSVTGEGKDKLWGAIKEVISA